MAFNMNQKEFAKKIGISQPRVSKLIQKGKLDKGVKKVKGRYLIDFAIAKKELKNTLHPMHTGREKPKKPVEDGADLGEEVVEGKEPNQYMKWNTFEKQYKAGIIKHNYDLLSGRVILKSEVERDLFIGGRMARDAMLNVAPRVAPILASKTDIKEIIKIINDEVEIILTDLSERLKKVVI